MTSRVSPQRTPTSEVVIIGAGPYGMAAASHLLEAGVETRVFGQVMGFWKARMPNLMLLRSLPAASDIADPRGSYSLSEYAARHSVPLEHPLPREVFVRYGEWFQRETVPVVDPRTVSLVEPNHDHFEVTLEDGERFSAGKVVAAAGPGSFAWKPPQFDDLPSGLASHSSQHASFAQFSGQSVLVIGGGQSALESAALLHEAGAGVEVLVRRDRVHWLDEDRPEDDYGPLHRLLYWEDGVGPPGINWLVAAPGVFRGLPVSLKRWVARKALRPAGAFWLRSRLKDVRITTERTVSAVAASDGRLRVRLDDGSEREVDHALLATGYRVDLARYSFLPPTVVQSIRTSDGFPVLGGGFESSVPGLFFLGAPATRTFGPGMMFVLGTRYSARALLRAVRKPRSVEHP
jgi:thioredoxin reductase